MTTSPFARTLAELRGEAKAVPAPRTLTLPPSVFASEWKMRPTEPVVVGLRLLPDAEEQTARAEALRIALELHPDTRDAGDAFVDAYNDALLRWIVARGICDPNDVTAPTQILPMAEDQVRHALTSSGVRYIFDAIERLQLETSPIYAEASFDEVAELLHRLGADPDVGSLAGITRKRALRVLRYVLLELRAAGPDQDELPVDLPDSIE